MKSIIIPHYGNHLEDLLKPCLESIIKYTDLDDLEVIVVCNGSTLDAREYVESLGEPFKVLWFDEGQGFTRATNLGVEMSKGDIIILMNNDFLLLPQPKNQWLDFLCDPLKGKVGMTGNLKIWDESVERMFIVFFCCAFPRHIWEKVGPLDEAWTPGGGEDIEFCLKVEQLGYKIIQVPDEHNEVINGINVNRFMSYHVGEATMLSEERRESWIEHIKWVRERLREKYCLPQGWFYGEDIEEYRQLVEDVPEGGTIGELGCAYGRSICSVADIIKRKKLKVVIVDTFEGTVSEREPGQGPDDFEQAFRGNIKRFGIEADIHRGMTHDVVKNIPDRTFDLLFIDADHSYESVKQDIEDWLPKIKVGGKISGHDYGNVPGVGKAVNEKFSNIRVNQLQFEIKSGIATSSVWSKRI